MFSTRKLEWWGYVLKKVWLYVEQFRYCNVAWQTDVRTDRIPTSMLVCWRAIDKHSGLARVFGCPVVAMHRLLSPGLLLGINSEGSRVILLRRLRSGNVASRLVRVWCECNRLAYLLSRCPFYELDDCIANASIENTAEEGNETAKEDTGREIANSKHIEYAWVMQCLHKNYLLLFLA